jgi:hypothetical protein
VSLRDFIIETADGDGSDCSRTRCLIGDFLIGDLVIFVTAVRDSKITKSRNHKIPFLTRRSTWTRGFARSSPMSHVL